MTTISTISNQDHIAHAPADAGSAAARPRDTSKPRGRRIANAPAERIASSTTGQPPPLERWVLKPEVLELTGLSYVTIWQMMRDGRFPQSYDVGGKVAWREGDIRTWNTTRPVRRLKPIAKGAL